MFQVPPILLGCCFSVSDQYSFIFGLSFGLFNKFFANFPVNKAFEMDGEMMSGMILIPIFWDNILIPFQIMKQIKNWTQSDEDRLKG